MAVPSRPDPELEALLHEGAAEIVRLNPHIGAAPPAYSDEEELDALWNSSEGQHAQSLGYSASDAVDEDRGE